jgi:hypothetical protein
MCATLQYGKVRYGKLWYGQYIITSYYEIFLWKKLHLRSWRLKKNLWKIAFLTLIVEAQYALHAALSVLKLCFVFAVQRF